MGGGIYNIPNGGFAIPKTDSTFTSGLNYAQSIAGGQNVPNMIAPGVSYSSAMPQGFTQAQLNGTQPQQPVYQEPDDTNFLGTGIGGYSMPFDRKQQLPPVEKIFGNIPSTPIQVPPQEFNIEQLGQNIADSGIDFANLFGLPKAPDLSQFVTKDDLPNGRDFSIDQLNLPDFDEFVLREDLPVYKEQDLSDFAKIADLPTFDPQNYRDDFLSIAREGIDIPQFDASGLQQQIGGLEKQIAGIPQFNPQDYRDDFLSIAREGIDIPQYEAPDLSSFMTQADINKAISGINIPSYEQPDLSGYNTRLAELEQSLLELQQPNGDSFSINQPPVRGLF